MKRQVKTKLNRGLLAKRISQMDYDEVLDVYAVENEYSSLAMGVMKVNVMDGCDVYLCNVYGSNCDFQAFPVEAEFTNEQVIALVVEYFYITAANLCTNVLYLQSIKEVEVPEKDLLIPSISKVGAKFQIIDYLTKWIRENGNIPFEHGFVGEPIQAKKYGNAELYIREVQHDAKICVKVILPNGKPCYDILALKEFTKAQLIAIIDNCNRYYLYCRYEA